MVPVICKNDLRVIIDKIQESLEKGRTIRGIRLVDVSDAQVVILTDDKPISQDRADGWWQCYQTMLIGDA